MEKSILLFLIALLMVACHRQEPALPAYGTDGIADERDDIRSRLIDYEPEKIIYTYEAGILNYSFTIEKALPCSRLKKQEVVLDTEEPQVIIALSTRKSDRFCPAGNETISGSLKLDRLPGGIIVVLDGRSIYARALREAEYIPPRRPQYFMN